MAYQPINIPNRQGAKQLDVELEEPKEKEIEKTTTVKVEEKEPEPEVKEELEVDLNDGDDDNDDDDEELEDEEPKQKEEAPKPKKKKPGRPKGSTNKKRDKRIQQLLEDKKKEAAKNAALEAKLEALEKQMHDSSRASTASRKNTLEQAIESLQSQLKSAIEDDDAAAIVDIQNKMMKANMEYAAVNYEFENTPEEYTPAPKQKQQQPDASPYALDWVDQHPAFNEDEEFNAAALGVNAKLLKLGFDPETPEFYDELDKRLSKRYPEYFDTSSEDVVEYKEDDESDDSESDIPQTVAGASRTPSGSTSGSKKSGRKKKNTVILTESDQILCQKWGISPVDFAKRKKALEGKEKGEYTDIK